MYNSTLGRFIQRDPIALQKSDYVYSSNNPTNKIDPSGQQDIYVTSSNKNVWWIRTVTYNRDIIGVRQGTRERIDENNWVIKFDPIDVIAAIDACMDSISIDEVLKQGRANNPNHYGVAQRGTNKIRFLTHETTLADIFGNEGEIPVFQTHGLPGALMQGSSYNSANNSYEPSNWITPDEISGFKVKSAAVVIYGCKSLDASRGKSVASAFAAQLGNDKVLGSANIRTTRTDTYTNFARDSQDDIRVRNAMADELVQLVKKYSNGIPFKSGGDANYLNTFQIDLNSAFQKVFDQYKSRGLTDLYFDSSIRNYRDEIKRPE